MIQQNFNYTLRSLSWRLFTASLLVILPVGISTSWLAAAVQHAWEQVDFLETMVRSLVSGTLTTILASFMLLYPLERWMIRDRATHAWKWVLTRILVYILAGLPIGIILLAGMRLGTTRRSALVESSYFILAVTNSGVIGLVYSFLERVIQEAQRREAQLQHQIAQLHIEIDEVKKAHQVAEITETEYFHALHRKALQLRGNRGGVPRSD